MTTMWVWAFGALCEFMPSFIDTPPFGVFVSWWCWVEAVHMRRSRWRRLNVGGVALVVGCAPGSRRPPVVGWRRRSDGSRAIHRWARGGWASRGVDADALERMADPRRLPGPSSSGM